MGMMTRRNVKRRVVVKTTPALAFTKENIVENQYTKTEVNRMSTADLKKLAAENGLDDSLSGAEIKKALIKKFGL